MGRTRLGERLLAPYPVAPSPTASKCLIGSISTKPHAGSIRAMGTRTDVRLIAQDECRLQEAMSLAVWIEAVIGIAGPPATQSGSEFVWSKDRRRVVASEKGPNIIVRFLITGKDPFGHIERYRTEMSAQDIAKVIQAWLTAE